MGGSRGGRDKGCTDVAYDFESKDSAFVYLCALHTHKYSCSAQCSCMHTPGGESCGIIVPVPRQTLRERSPCAREDLTALKSLVTKYKRYIVRGCTEQLCSQTIGATVATQYFHLVYVRACRVMMYAISMHHLSSLAHICSISVTSSADTCVDTMSSSASICNRKTGTQ